MNREELIGLGDASIRKALANMFAILNKDGEILTKIGGSDNADKMAFSPRLECDKDCSVLLFDDEDKARGAIEEILSPQEDGEYHIFKFTAIDDDDDDVDGGYDNEFEIDFDYDGDDGDISEEVVIRMDDEGLGMHGFVKDSKGKEIELTDDIEEAEHFQHEELGQNNIEAICAKFKYDPKSFSTKSIDPRAEEPYEDDGSNVEIVDGSEFSDSGEMSLDDAIEHAREVGTKMLEENPDCGCGKEHLQLAKWLEELRSIRGANGDGEENKDDGVEESVSPSVNDIRKILKRNGFQLVSQKGSMQHWKKDEVDEPIELPCVEDTFDGTKWSEIVKSRGLTTDFED
jgi:hypothetical protein